MRTLCCTFAFLASSICFSANYKCENNGWVLTIDTQKGIGFITDKDENKYYSNLRAQENTGYCTGGGSTMYVGKVADCESCVGEYRIHLNEKKLTASVKLGGTRNELTCTVTQAD
jgi:hypothetical protein